MHLRTNAKVPKRPQHLNLDQRPAHPNK